MASLQSTLGISELREETLRTWGLFVKTLRYADIGPFIGRTTAAFIANWDSFSASERKMARETVEEIADNASHLSAYLDEIVDLHKIPELRVSAAKLIDYRKSWTVHDQLNKLLERSASQNVAVAMTSIYELKQVLLSRRGDIKPLFRGDTFHPLAGTIIRTLLAAATRDGDCDELRELAYEALGIVGALDPDRLVSLSEPPSMTIMSNFADAEESADFAIHLIRDLLVDAFRATNDTKLQGHLAFAIQELLKFCGFTPKILQSSSIAVKTLSRWEQLPKDQHETLTPLLESRFSLTDMPLRQYQYPIYDTAPTYREWLQMWTTDLIGKNLLAVGDGRAIRDSQAIFGVFRGVLKNQDVTVAHHLLPHLVLNVLLSNHGRESQDICLEINSVLKDQVNGIGPADKRNLSAQVIFELMDHLSKWLRLQRSGTVTANRGHGIKVVELVVSSIETELMANAALQSKAYARSLRNFEQRIVQLRKENRSNSDLQTYFERVHQIYADLDEPDGMEGISTFVIAPSLEHQIREHESTGRWTSAQSCWEVRLQQSPEDVTLHIGLLKCLRNLGHYGTLRDVIIS